MYHLMVDEENDQEVMKKISQPSISLRELEEILEDGWVQSYYHDEIYRYRFSASLGEYIIKLIEKMEANSYKKQLSMIGEYCINDPEYVDADTFRIYGEDDVAKLLQEFPNSSFKIDLDSIDSLGDLAYYISNNNVPYLVTLCQN